MMQSNDYYGAPSHQDDEYETLLPQQYNGGTSRRRTGGGIPQSQLHQNNMHNDTNGNMDDDNKYDKERQKLTSIKSISRIGRSTGTTPIPAGTSSPGKSANDDFDGAVTTATYHTNTLNIDENQEAEYYYDDTNDYSNSCTFGTEEENGIWLNTHDGPGIAMAVIVWILIIYSGLTITLLAQTKNISHMLAYFYCTICTLALASHAKTMFTDPGAVPQSAVPIDSAARQHEEHVMCRNCKSYKPPGSHHCRICNRCVSRMDHHCPWMNNCVGAGNLKSFILFLCYTWIGSALSLIIFASNYFFCREESCEFSGVLIQLVRVMTLICTGSIMFTSSMLANVTFGVMTGSGTIDRLKRKYGGENEYEPDDPPLEFSDIFGIGSTLSCLLPIDPVFPDQDKVLGFSTTQRLLREGNDNTSVC